MSSDARLAILGTGNIGRAIATGLTAAGRFRPEQVILTRRHAGKLAELAERGFVVQSDHRGAQPVGR